MLIEVPNHVSSQVLRDIDFGIKEAKQFVQLVRQLSTDDGLNRAVNDGEFNEFNGMIGRLCDYPDLSTTLTTVEQSRRVFRKFHEPLGRLCPVVMKGSRWNLHRKYAKSQGGCHPNGWHEHVAERYLRMIKHTSICWDKEREKQYNIIARWAGQTWGKFDNPLAPAADVAMIMGREYWIKNHDMRQALKSLIRQIHKIDYIDRCVEKIEATI